MYLGIELGIGWVWASRHVWYEELIDSRRIGRVATTDRVHRCNHVGRLEAFFWRHFCYNVSKSFLNQPHRTNLILSSELRRYVSILSYSRNMIIELSLPFRCNIWRSSSNSSIPAFESFKIFVKNDVVIGECCSIIRRNATLLWSCSPFWENSWSSHTHWDGIFHSRDPDVDGTAIQ